MTAMPEQAYVYNARMVRVVDGDTVDIEIDTGMHGRRVERLRLLGVNAPEMRGQTREAGEGARQFVFEWMTAAWGDAYREAPDVSEYWELRIQTYKADDFGRYLADVWRRSDGTHLNADLLASGHAVEYVR